MYKSITNILIWQNSELDAGIITEHAYTISKKKDHARKLMLNGWMMARELSVPEIFALSARSTSAEYLQLDLAFRWTGMRGGCLSVSEWRKWYFWMEGTVDKFYQYIKSPLCVQSLSLILPMPAAILSPMKWMCQLKLSTNHPHLPPPPPPPSPPPLPLNCIIEILLINFAPIFFWHRGSIKH